MAGQSVGPARAVAQVYAKLLAYKDEYEVARLMTAPGFSERLERQFDGDYTIAFNLAPPVLPGTDPNGRPKKREFGPWMLKAFRLLAPMRHLRGTPLDVFGYGADRRLERRLIKDYEALVDTIVQRLRPDNEEAAIAALSSYDAIRGFGPVKEQAAADVRSRQDRLLAALDAGSEKVTAAAAA